MYSGRRKDIGLIEHSIEEEKNNKKIGGEFTPKKNAEYIQHRIQIFDRLYEQQINILKQKEHDKICIELPDGSIKEGFRFETSPYDIALSISKNLAENVLVAKVLYKEKLVDTEKLVCADKEEEEEKEEEKKNEEEENEEEEKYILWDLKRPLEASCKIKLLKFIDDEGKNVFWHSSAHLLGQAIELEYGAHLTVGPALSSGFYYDAYMGDFRINSEAYIIVENNVLKIINENQEFKRLVCTKEEALEIFKHNPFKVKLIHNKIPQGGKTTCYRCGSLVDLCRGPHVTSTGKIKAFCITKHSSSYWLAKSNLDSLQRIYGISFPDSKQLKEYKFFLEEAKKKDHRLLGNNLSLYFFDTNVSPGSCFWLPYGARLYNKLCDFIRAEYKIRGFTEVVTPNIFSCDLWKTSGHYANYKENMYLFDIEGKEWGLKPMNCPSHCLIFKHLNLSYKQLPLRLADFGVLHRNELSGTLAGLTRVRRFQQDDAHIFCRLDQLKDEVWNALQFLFFVYEKFNFTFELKLATRPKKALGSKDLWDKAETALREALNMTNMSWSVNPGDGAFYGPKIDIRVWDALKRAHQCGTIQVDFQLPIRFNLQYKTDEIVSAGQEEKKEDGNIKKEEEIEEKSIRIENKTLKEEKEEYKEKKLKVGFSRPVIVHRAILGSIERMCAILIEHTEGKLPFWLSPRQIIVLPVSNKFDKYAQWVYRMLTSFGFYSEVDDSSNTINKKIREAQMNKWNYMLVVGNNEVSKGSVTIRSREDQKNQKEMQLEDFIKLLEEESFQNSQPFKKFIPWDPQSLENTNEA